MASIKTLTVIFAWSLFGLFRLLYTVSVTEYNRILIFKEPIPDKALSGHVIRTEKVVNEGSCRAKCYLEPNCVSINVGPAHEGERICELKNFTDESSTHSALEEKKHYIHFSVENFCQSSPCPGKNSLCQVGFTDTGYRCVCRDGQGYQCNEALAISLVICEGSGKENIRCDDGKTISILSANFGRLDGTTCYHQLITTTDCHATNSLEKVQETCQHKESCELSATTSFFGRDPCHGTHKYLLVEYKCDMKNN